MASKRHGQKAHQQPNSIADSTEIGNLRQEIQYKEDVISMHTADLEKLKKILTCLVCTELISQPFTIQCGHVFCYTCINGWLGNKKTCPTCRMKVSHKPVFTFMIKEMVDILVARTELADPHGEGAVLRTHQKKQEDDVMKDKEDLFPGIFAETSSRRIRDEDDDVWRCSRCHHEVMSVLPSCDLKLKIEGRECLHCGLVFSDASDDDESFGDSEEGEVEDDSDGSLEGFIEHDEYDRHSRRWFHIDAVDGDGTDYSSDIHEDEIDPEVLAFIDNRNTSELEDDNLFDDTQGLSETENVDELYDDSMMEELAREHFEQEYCRNNVESSHYFHSSDPEDEHIRCTPPNVSARRRQVIHTIEDESEEPIEGLDLSSNDLEVADSEASEIVSDSGPLRGRGPNYFSPRDFQEDDSNSEEVNAAVQMINPRRRKRARTDRPAAVTITIDSDEDY